MTVSVVIPNWNRSALLGPLLKSIHEQSLPEGIDVEILVVDNGSTDDSVDVARNAGARVVALERNEGVSRAFNRGIKASRGEWVALLNNDVELTPEWFCRTLDALMRSSAWFATGKTLDYTTRSCIDGAGDAICRGGASWRLGHGRPDGPIFDRPRQTYFPSATATVFRRDFFGQVGFFEESFFAYLEDVDMGFRAAVADLPGVYVPGAVAFHRSGETAGPWSSQMVEWLTCHQLLLLAKFYSAGLLLRFGAPILAAQLLWGILAVSRGRAAAWARGVGRGLRRFIPLRKASSSLRQAQTRLAAVLCRGEAEIAQVQQATGWDTYWRWYFRLALPALEARP